VSTAPIFSPCPWCRAAVVFRKARLMARKGRVECPGCGATSAEAPTVAAAAEAWNRIIGRGRK